MDRASWRSAASRRLVENVTLFRTTKIHDLQAGWGDTNGD
jgi:hypothetical protein